MPRLFSVSWSLLLLSLALPAQAQTLRDPTWDQLLEQERYAELDTQARERLKALDREGVIAPLAEAAADALATAGLAPLRLRPKEGLAVMNGTAVMTALACLAHARADYLARLATRITALASLSLDGNPKHFDHALFAVKPHAGQQRVAARIFEDLAATPPERNEHRLQDRYSIRCAPHVIGVLEDALPSGSTSTC